MCMKIVAMNDSTRVRIEHHFGEKEILGISAFPQNCLSQFPYGICICPLRILPFLRQYPYELIAFYGITEVEFVCYDFQLLLLRTNLYR